MKKQPYTALFILTISLATFFSLQPASVVSAQPFQDITIYPDGYIDPPSAPLTTSDKSTYNFTGNIYGHILIYRDNILLDGRSFTLQGRGISTDVGIDLDGQENVTIQNILIKTCNQGIRIDSCSHINLYGNQITNTSYGVWIDSSSYSSVCGNNISANDFGGLQVYFSSNNLFSNNTVSDDGNTGFTLVGSNNTISGNILNNNPFTFMMNSYFEPCQNNCISNNIISRSDYGMWFSSQSKPNTICNNNVTGNNITQINIACVTLEYCSNNTFTGNCLSSESGGFGFGVEYSCNNTFFANTITNTSVGIGLIFSSDCNSVSGNNITNQVFGGTGIQFVDSKGSIVVGNNLVNGYCITLEESSANTFYYNNFFGSTYQVYDLSWSVNDVSASANNWDNGSFSGGNYWSDYNDRYPSASEINSSGIWNAPYKIDSTNQDNYPLILSHTTAQSPAPIPPPPLPSATPTPSASPTTTPSKTSSSSSASSQKVSSEASASTTPTAPELPSLILILILLVGGLTTIIAYKRLRWSKQGPLI